MHNVTLYYNHTGLHSLASLVARYDYVTKFWLIKCEWKVYHLLPGLASRTECAFHGHFPGN